MWIQKLSIPLRKTLSRFYIKGVPDTAGLLNPAPAIPSLAIPADPATPASNKTFLYFTCFSPSVDEILKSK